MVVPEEHGTQGPTGSSQGSILLESPLGGSPGGVLRVPEGPTTSNHGYVTGQAKAQTHPTLVYVGYYVPYYLYLTSFRSYLRMIARTCTRIRATMVPPLRNDTVQLEVGWSGGSSGGVHSP